MKILFLFTLLFLLFLFPSFLFAAAIDRRISDQAGQVLDINSDGSFTATSTTESDTDLAQAASDIRISDNDAHVLDIQTNGTIILEIVG